MADHNEPHNDPTYRMDEYYEETRRHSVARGVVVMVVSVLILGVFVAGVTIAYQLGVEAGSSKVTPIIRADTSPTKVRPTDPGGMNIPNQDKTVYGQIAQTNGQDEANGEDKGEKLLPKAERPIESLLLTIRPATAPAAANDQPKAPDPEPVVAAEAAPPIKLPPPPPPEKPDPKRPTSAEIKTGPSPKAPAVVAAVTPPPPPPAPPAVSPSKATKPKPATTRVASAKAAPAPEVKKATGAYRVQLASAKSAKGARRVWGKLRKAHPDLFGSLSESVVRRNLGPQKGTWYRLMAGGFPSANAAKAFCGKAKKRKVACLPVRRR